MNWSSRIIILLRLSICLGISFSPRHGCAIFAAEPMSWPRFDGPQHNRVSREENLDLRWSKQEQTLPVSRNLQLWSLPRSSDDSTPLVFNNKLYLASTGKKKKKTPAPFLVSCWNIKGRDPEFIYQYEIPKLTSSAPSDVKTEVPFLVGDSLLRQLFCLTRQGEVHALDSDLGHPLWKKSLSQIVGQKMAPVCLATPLIFEQCLIISAGWYDAKTDSTTIRLLALDRRNGQVIWVARSRDSFSSDNLPAPVSVVYGGQVVVAAQLQPGKIRLIQIRTGKQVVQFNLSAENSLARELLYESEQLAVLSRSPQIPVKHAAETKPFQWSVDLFALPAAIDSTPDEKKKPALKKTIRFQLADSHHATALLHQKRLYVINTGGLLREYQASSGKLLAETILSDLPQIQKKEGVGTPDTEHSVEENKKNSGQIVHHLIFAEQQLLVTSTAGLWCGLGEDQKSASKKSGSKILFRQQLDGVLTIPVISKGRIYVRRPGKLTALGPIDNLVAVSSIIEPLTILAKENKSTTPGKILITPGLQHLQPGWKQKFQVQLYSSRGVFLRMLKPDEIQWGDPVLGKFEKKTGTYFAPQKLSNKIEEVTDVIEVKYKSFSARATVRVASE